MMVDNSDETLSILKAMRRQEKSYTCQDYCRIHGTPSIADSRTSLVQWAERLVDFAQLPRENVDYTMSFVDRFMEKSMDGLEFLQSSSQFQLLVIAALMLAVKIHTDTAISPRLFQEISRGRYSVDSILNMELKLLDALSFRVNPPTKLSFVKHYLDLVPLDEEMKNTAFILSQMQTELAVHDYEFVTVKSSTVAFAALRNSLEALGLDDYDIATVSGLVQHGNDEPEDVSSLQSRLYNAIANQTRGIHLPNESKSPASSTAEKVSGRKIATNRRAFEETTPCSPVLTSHAA